MFILPGNLNNLPVQAKAWQSHTKTRESLPFSAIRASCLLLARSLSAQFGTLSPPAAFSVSGVPPARYHLGLLNFVDDTTAETWLRAVFGLLVCLHSSDRHPARLTHFVCRESMMMHPSHAPASTGSRRQNPPAPAARFAPYRASSKGRPKTA